MDLVDYLMIELTDDQLIQAVSEYLDISIPVNEVQALKADTRLLQAIFLTPILEDCYTSTGNAHIKHKRDCIINLTCKSLQGYTGHYRSV